MAGVMWRVAERVLATLKQCPPTTGDRECTTRSSPSCLRQLQRIAPPWRGTQRRWVRTVRLAQQCTVRIYCEDVAAAARATGARSVGAVVDVVTVVVVEVIVVAVVAAGAGTASAAGAGAAGAGADGGVADAAGAARAGAVTVLLVLPLLLLLLPFSKRLHMASEMLRQVVAWGMFQRNQFPYLEVRICRSVDWPHHLRERVKVQQGDSSDTPRCVWLVPARRVAATFID
jgi:hypothetical protein